MAVPDWADREKVKADLIKCGRVDTICGLIVIAFALVGIIGDAADITLGLELISWFLIAILTWLFGITARIGWAVSWHLNTNK